MTTLKASRPWDKGATALMVRGSGGAEVRACQAARSSHLCRNSRLWSFRRCPSRDGPQFDGNGAYRAMQAALKRAGWSFGYRSSMPTVPDAAWHLIELGAVNDSSETQSSRSRCPRPSRPSATSWSCRRGSDLLRLAIGMHRADSISSIRPGLKVTTHKAGSRSGALSIPLASVDQCSLVLAAVD